MSRLASSARPASQNDARRYHSELEEPRRIVHSGDAVKPWAFPGAVASQEPATT